MHTLATPHVTPAAAPAAPTAKRAAVPRPPLPFEPFPLTWHVRGYFQKKRGGRVLRFTADPNESYDLWRDLLDRERRGEQAAPAARKRYTLRDAVNLYLTRQKRRLEDRELSPVQFVKCRFELQKMLPRAIALGTPLGDFNATTPDDSRPGELFRRIAAKAGKRGLEAMRRHVILVRACLDRAARKHLMRAPDYGDDFDPPSSSRIDRSREQRDAEQGERAWSIDELHKILAEARRLSLPRKTAGGKRPGRNPHLYAQVLLGLFAAFGSDDCSALMELGLKRDREVIASRRAKNGRPTIAWLPPRVWKAIDVSLAHRAEPADDDAAHLVFRTDAGRRCNVAPHKSDEHGLLKVGRNDTIGKNFQRTVKRLDVRKNRAGFKTLRAMCRTLLVGAGVGEDIVAAVMGRPLRHRADEYYLRGDLKAELVKAGKHLERQLFPAVKRTAPPRSPGHAARGAAASKPR